MSAKITYNYITNSFKSVGYNSLSIERLAGRCIVKYACTNNHTHYIRWDHWQRGDRCGSCRKTSIDYIRKEFEKEGG